MSEQSQKPDSNQKQSEAEGPFSTSVLLGKHKVMFIEIPIAGQSPVRLTEAEKEIAELLLLGATNQEIADRRGTSVNTVQNQVASIYEKVGVHSRSELSRAMVSVENELDDGE